MSPELQVVLNDRRLHDATAPESFAVDGPFSVHLENRGEAVHVHLHLDDALSRVASLSGGNHYVEGEARREVPVRVEPGPEPVRGKLKVVTGYGAETTYVDLTVEAAPEPKPRVEVDEDLAKPKREPTPPSLGERVRAALPESPGLPLLALGVAALALAGVVATTVDNGVVLLGVGVVIGGVVAAIVFAVR